MIWRNLLNFSKVNIISFKQTHTNHSLSADSANAAAAAAASSSASNDRKSIEPYKAPSNKSNTVCRKNHSKSNSYSLLFSDDTESIENAFY